MLLIEDKRFYVYIYLDPLKPGNYLYNFYGKIFYFLYEPFYVGRGCNKRFYDHIIEAKRDKLYKKNTSHKKHRIKKILESNKNPIIIKIIENITKKLSEKFEFFLVKLIGRRNLNTGPLTNLVEGGLGDFAPGVLKPKNEYSYILWKRKIDKYYTKKRRKEFGFANTLDGYILKFGKIDGEKLYNKRIEKMKENIHKTYENEEIKNKCKNFGAKNGFFGKKSSTAIKVEINGKQFDSIKDASIDLKIPYTTLSQRLKNKKLGYKILN